LVLGRYNFTASRPISGLPAPDAVDLDDNDDGKEE
jgi:hypothetical protein